MTHPRPTDLSDLMRRGSEQLDPASGRLILDRALVRGARRRRTRHLGVGLAVAAVLATGTGAVVAVADGSGTSSVPVAGSASTAVSTAADPTPTPDPTTPTGTPTPTAAPSYGPGSATEVPEGPVIATDRRVVGDARLAQVTRDLLPPGVASDLEVAHVWSSNPSHQADTTNNGREVSFTFDGAAASVTIQRWDGYAAVGVDLRDVDNLPEGLEDLPQLVVTTARDACMGLHRSSVASQCRPAPGGYYTTYRPSQGDAMPDSYQELYVSFFTDDGYVVIVDSYNTPAEKTGPVLADEPVLDVEESVAMATSGDWFAAR